MPLRAPQVFPNDQRSWDQWTRNVQVTPDDGSVTTVKVADKSITDPKLRDSQPTSVIGRTTNTLGIPGDIIAGADDRFLVRRSGALAFGTIGDADIPASIARGTEVAAGDATVTSAFQAADATVANNAAAALASHVAAADPHPVYLTQTEGDARYRQQSISITYSEITSKPAVLALLYSGTGSPETVVTAGVGSLYLRTDGGSGTTLYIKESGSGNTGWIGK